jgi:hypothetical protein
MKKPFLQVPFFVFLMPIFFVLHGYYENFGFINWHSCSLLALTYCVATTIVYGFFLLLYKKAFKAALLTAYCMGFYFFFGAIYDALLQYAFGLHRYKILLPFFLLLFVVLLWRIKKLKQSPAKLIIGLNLLFTIYLLVDAAGIVSKLIHPPTHPLATYHLAQQTISAPCLDGQKPDIYFLLFDEYASTEALQEQFLYNNQVLDSFLLQHQFKIQFHSRSNYNFTPFSMASILNMSYLSGIENTNAVTIEDYAKCNALIKNNAVIALLSAQGYNIVNYSIFDLAGNPSPVQQTFLPLQANLISGRTLLAYLKRDVAWQWYAATNNEPWLTQNAGTIHVKNTNKLINDILRVSKQSSTTPKFVYAHFYMPHAPYYIGKNFKLKNPATIFKENKERSHQAYLDYLPYVNNKIKELVTGIQQNTHHRAAIILMGDHGYRSNIPASIPLSNFQNLNAVYLPNKNYHAFYDSISGVNQFGIIFNTLFKTAYPLQKDSCILLTDK